MTATANFDASVLPRTLVRSVFAATVMLSIFLVKWSIAGIPIRSMTALLVIFAVGAWRPDMLFHSLRESRTVICIIALSALIGAVSSLLNSNDAAEVGRQLLELHVQAIVGTILGVVVRETCGARTIMRAFAMAVGISAVVAVLQFLDVRAAWNARHILDSLQQADAYDAHTEGSLAPGRAMGLSYTPVHLATQLCLLFAAIFAYRLRLLGDGLFAKADAGLLLTSAALAAVAVASGNRSPLLGMLVFIVFYLWVTQRGSAIMLAAVALSCFPLVLALPEALRSLGLRIGETADGSAVGRTVLEVYGLLLFLARPIGYGLTFDSTEHWVGFWSYVRDFDSASAIATYALHNYFLMMVNKYGFPILFLAGAILWNLARYRWALLGFVPYAIHIFFHNDGPLQGDFLIWYIFPMYAGFARPSSVRRPAVMPPGLIARWATGPKSRDGLRPPAGFRMPERGAISLKAKETT